MQKNIILILYKIITNHHISHISHINHICHIDV